MGCGPGWGSVRAFSRSRGHHLRYLSLPAGLIAATLGLAIGGCGAPTESHQTFTPTRVSAASRPYDGPRHRIVLGKVQNKSPYMNGIFAEGSSDRLGDQARQILETHLADSSRFTVANRTNLDEAAREAKIGNTQQQLTAGEYLITGAVTEFGRRETGGAALGGILGRNRTQMVHAKVQLNVVDVRTSEVVTTVQGQGEYALSSEHVLGFGSEAGYDATLADKVLNLAIIEAVDRLSEQVDRGTFRGGAQ